MSFLRTVGRMGLSTIFISSGINALQHPEYVEGVADANGLPEPDLLAKVHAGTNVVAGATMALGILPRLSALALAANLVPATVLGHNPTEAPDEESAQAQQVHALKNASLLGGLLMVMGGNGGGDDADGDEVHARNVEGSIEDVIDAVLDAVSDFASLERA